jgi:uncharacterized protein with NRDE domain
MCLILFAYRVHPRHELLLAANRDEYYSRPTAPMQFWDHNPQILAGRDLQGHGSWLGVTPQGRLAAVTNYRDPARLRATALSRGLLVRDYLSGHDSAWNYLQRVQRWSEQYNGFSLLLRDTEGLYYFCNRSGEPRLLEPGLYGLSNHLLNTPWPKVEKGRRELAALLAADPEPSLTALLSLLEDPAQAPEAELPHTGVSLQWERLLSAIFITAPGYGTRSSTALRASRDGALWLVEKTWPEGHMREFRLHWPKPC